MVWCLWARICGLSCVRNIRRCEFFAFAASGVGWLHFARSERICTFVGSFSLVLFRACERDHSVLVCSGTPLTPPPSRSVLPPHSVTCACPCASASLGRRPQQPARCPRPVPQSPAEQRACARGRGGGPHAGLRAMGGRTQRVVADEPHSQVCCVCVCACVCVCVCVCVCTT